MCSSDLGAGRVRAESDRPLSLSSWSSTGNSPGKSQEDVNEGRFTEAQQASQITHPKALCFVWVKSFRTMQRLFSFLMTQQLSDVGKTNEPT